MGCVGNVRPSQAKKAGFSVGQCLAALGGQRTLDIGFSLSSITPVSEGRVSGSVS